MRRGERSGSLIERAPARENTNYEVFRRYRGFDGVAWPELEHPEFCTEDGLADLADLGRVKAYVARLSRADECDIIALARIEVSASIPALAGWKLAGFDVGYFETEWSHFSVVLNEILYATRPELRRFAAALNEHLLIPTLDTALEVIVERGRMATAGADLEQAAYIEPVAIFLREISRPKDPS